MAIEEVHHRRLERLLGICKELDNQLLYVRALAAYALETQRLDVYLRRLEEYKMVETKLVIYRYIIGVEWGRIARVRTRTLPPVIDADTGVASWV